MYHCHIRFLLLGSQNKMFEQIKQAAPMEHFAHDFLENAVIDEPMVSSADVILACLSGMDVSATVPLLVSGMNQSCNSVFCGGSSLLKRKRIIGRPASTLNRQSTASPISSGTRPRTACMRRSMTVSVRLSTRQRHRYRDAGTPTSGMLSMTTLPASNPNWKS